jgi:protein SCO1
MWRRGAACRLFLWLLTCSWCAVLAWGVPALAHHAAEHQPPGVLAEVRFDQRLDAQVPLDLVFRDETGTPVPLGAYFGQKPVILTLNYYDCPMLCPLALEGLVRSLRPLSFSIGDQFEVLTVSFDPRETPELAAAAKVKYTQDYARPGAASGWHFLTGTEESIQRLTEAVGFRAVYDADKQQYAHAAGIVVLTPQGRVARYLYGVELPTRDLRLVLVEAAAGEIGSPVDRLLLFCYRYDPATGQYSLLVMKTLRLAGLATLLSLGGFMAVMFRRERARIAPSPDGRGGVGQWSQDTADKGESRLARRTLCGQTCRYFPSRRPPWPGR